MVITILEAHVSPEKSAALELAYRSAVHQLDEGISQTFLLHAFNDPSLWRILTVWSSREALDKMRQSGETPRGVLIFRDAGADPILSVFDVVVHQAA
jgi:heme-degrading monooxygenase HmoA